MLKKYYILSAVVLVLLLSVSHTLLSQEEDEVDRLAVVSTFTGKVSIRHNLMVRPVTAVGNRIRNSSLYKKDTVITKSASTADIMFDDNTTLQISEDSTILIGSKTVTGRDRAERTFSRKVAIDQQSDVRVVKITVGSLRANITTSRTILTEFETPSGTASVRGTALDIGYLAGMTSISLFEGLLGFTSAGNEVGFDINPGNSVDIISPGTGTVAVSAREGDLEIDTDVGTAIVEEDEMFSIVVDKNKAETSIASERGSVVLVTDVGSISMDKGESVDVGVDPVTGNLTVAGTVGNVVITTDDGVTTAVEPGKIIGAAKETAKGKDAGAADSAEDDPVENLEGPHLLFIFDASRSMNDIMENNVSKLDAAKKALSDHIGTLPANLNVGLEVYGHKETADCGDIEIIVPIGRLDIDEMRQKIDSIQAYGDTSIAAALELAADAMRPLVGEKSIVLLSDGVETCGGDPIRSAARIRDEMGIDVGVHVAGLGVDSSEREQLAGISQAGGGTYHTADNSGQLEKTLTEIEKNEPLGEIYETNLLLKENGGHLMTAPQDEWKQTIDGMEMKAPVLAFSSAVYAFKYEQMATFNAFSVCIPGEADSNLMVFELLVSDRSWSGPFRSIGRFQALNSGTPEAPYQQIRFPDVTSRFLKVQLETNYGDSKRTVLYEFQLYGKLKDRGEY